MNDKSILILELISSTGLRTPFKYVKFSHPKILRNKTMEVPDKIKRSNIKERKPFEMIDGNDGTGTRKQQNQPTIELSPTQFVFEDIIKIEKVKDKVKEILVGTKIIPKVGTSSGNKEGNTIKVSTEDWSGEGKIGPIEFKSLEIVKGRTGKGLEKFYKAVQYITENFKQCRVSMTEIFLPYGTKFSYYPDGSRRTCAIVQIIEQGKKYTYILEVGRADSWSISTLVIISKNDLLSTFNLESIISGILENLLINNGHWNSCIINNYSFDFYRVKHITNQSISQYVSRIM